MTRPKYLRMSPPERATMLNLEKTLRSFRSKPWLTEGYEYVVEGEHVTELNLDSICNGLPESVAALKWLRTLNLKSNSLKTLPEELWQLESLQTLILNDNRLGALPEAVGNLRVLEELSINGT